MKKGVMLTLGFFLLSLTILSLAVVMYKNTQDMEKMFSKTASFNRIDDLYSSIEESVKEIMDVTEVIDVEIEDNKISFEEYWPNSNAEIFNDTITDFENFVETNFPEINLDTSEIQADLPLLIKTKNITYTHSHGTGFGKIKIIPEYINFNGYLIDVYSPIQNITSINFAESTSGDKRFYVHAYDAAGNSFTESEYVDLTETVDVDVNIVMGDDVRINVLPGSEGELEIENRADNSVRIKTSLEFSILQPDVKVTLPDSTLQVLILGTGSYRRDTIKIV